MGYYDNNREAEVSELLGKIIIGIKGNNFDDEMYIKTSDDKEYKFYHRQDCCENVRIEDVIGDLEDLLNSPLTMAEEVYNADGPTPEFAESYTWTFYKFATIKGYVTIRWLGESNGYYGEGVDFEEIIKSDE